ncbi:SAV1978 family virulence-associated passenger protein [Staphylococcus kloosii]|uniref:SAV1978 family virulence-associated passenger protein n=1 Tax=Staphylococcus kloosii TaxID=29384 RepID=UPI000D1E7BBC|nr:hypothetical protein BUZ59_04375 [Staphylococcus kloosii]
MRSQYFTNKHYLTKDNRRIAHVHIVGDAYKVCGHYKRFTEFKRRTFNKYEFEQFCGDRGLTMEE